MTNKKKRNLIIALMLILVAIVLAVGWLVNFLVPNKTTTSENSENTVINMLKCSASNPVGVFFTTDSALSHTHTIKVSFQGDNLRKIAYEYEGKYADNATGETDMSLMHAKYNNYMGIEAESLTPNFVTVEDTVKINLFADGDDLDSQNAVVFNLTSDEIRKINSKTAKEVQKIYQEKGFFCDFSE